MDIQILSKHEMREIVGGYIDACSANCSDGSSVECGGGSCTAHDHGHNIGGGFNENDGFCYNGDHEFTYC